MERVEFAPDEELHESLEFEWPEETGLTLDDFEVYRMYDRPQASYVTCGPLWLAVCEPHTLTRRLGREWYFVATAKPVEEIGGGLYFVRAAMCESNLSYVGRANGWVLPFIGLGRTGFLFQEEMDATLFHLWKGPSNTEELIHLLKKIGYG